MVWGLLGFVDLVVFGCISVVLVESAVSRIAWGWGYVQ
jgi:hypothetical protein